MRKNRENRNYIIMLTKQVMRETEIPCLPIQDQSLPLFTEQHWRSVHANISGMSAETKGRIVQKALISGVSDTTTTPHRTVGWYTVWRQLSQEMCNCDGNEILNNIATAVVIATMWDLIDHQLMSGG